MRDFGPNLGDSNSLLCDSRPSRREFLQTGIAGAAGLTLPAIAQAAGTSPAASSPTTSSLRNCITLLLVGSPGHLDTWDMKPNAPSEFRGPFRPIATSVPGIEICEHFPLMARLTDRLALVRSTFHDGPPLHETGQRLMMTGADFDPADERPWFGSVVDRLAGRKTSLPSSVILPTLLGDTGAGPYHGQTAGWLGARHAPYVPSVELSSESASAFRLAEEPEAVRDRYGRHPFGQSCLLARRLIERGVRCVNVNHFATVFNTLSWDMHAGDSNLPVGFDDYANQLCPQFDQAYSALIEDLDQRGLLSETVVGVLSEMGRTPRINPRGGRDHFSSAWTTILAGGPIRGGQVIGATDRTGSEIIDRPVHAAEIVASLYHAIGVDLRTACIPDAAGQPIPLVAAEPVAELF